VESRKAAKYQPHGNLISNKTSEIQPERIFDQLAPSQDPA
jgi:hypothetical protein